MLTSLSYEEMKLDNVCKCLAIKGSCLGKKILTLCPAHSSILGLINMLVGLFEELLSDRKL